MGDRTTVVYPVVPSVEQCSTSRTNAYNKVISSPLPYGSTLQRGHLLGIMRPTWLKTTESEERLKWLRQMIGKNLLVRYIEAFLHTTSSKLRSEESKLKEEERELFMKS